MQSSEFNRFAATLTTMAQAAYRAEASPETLRLYFAGLEDITLGDVESALTSHVRDPDRGRFFPTVADIVAKARTVAELRNDRARSTSPRIEAPRPADDYLTHEEVSERMTALREELRRGQGGPLFGSVLRVLEQFGLDRSDEPERDEFDRSKWLAEDPVERSQQIWGLVLQQINRKLSTGSLGERLPDNDNTRRALLESGAYVHTGSGIEPAAWSDLQRQPRNGEQRLTAWALRWHAKFRQAYCRAYGVEEPVEKYDPPRFGAQFDRKGARQ